MRTFVAIELPPPVRQRLNSRQRWLEQHLAQDRAGNLVRWTAPENLHLTLRFLGETSAAQYAALASAFPALARQQQQLELALHQLGCFPSFRRPNIVWIDLLGTLTALQALQSAVEAAVQTAGFLPEERPFTPHLTIGRARKDAAPAALQQAGTLLRRLAESFDAGKRAASFGVAEFVLMQSDLKPAGPIYTPVGSYLLGGS